MASRRHKAIMIVDNEPARRKRLYDVLKLTGEDIYSASTGKQAMQQIPHDKPHMIIVNVESSDVDGLRFIQELRTYGMGQRIKVLGVADGEGEPKQAAISAGADGCLQATIPPFELLEMVAQQLDIQRIEIPREQMTKRRGIVEEVVQNYRSRSVEARRANDRALKVSLLLPGGIDPLHTLTEDAGKGRV